MWWLLGAIVAAGLALLSWFLLAARRRRAQWDTELAEDRAEARWILHQLVPVAGSQPSAQWRGVWEIARPRVLALEERLGTLSAQAPDATRAAAAAALLDAVRGVTIGLGQLAESPDDAARQALTVSAQELRTQASPPGTPGDGTEPSPPGTI